MVDAVLGKINPGGKLNETWPVSLADTPCHAYFPGEQRTCEYREGLFVGYRYYDTAEVPVRYPFGYGMSYTSFAYSDLTVSEGEVSFTLTNTGDRDGAEVAQLYVSCPDSGIYRPRKELKGFQKVFLKAGESRRVTIAFDSYTFRYFDVQSNGWKVEEGDYQILIASDASRVQLQGAIHVSGEKAEDRVAECYRTADIKKVSDDDFRQLLGREIPEGAWQGELELNDALCRMSDAKSGVARLLGRLLTRLKNKAEASGKPDLNIMFVYNMPFRALAKFSGGLVSMEMAEDILFLVNGHFFRGLGRVIRDFFRNLSRRRNFKRLLNSFEQ